MENGKKTYRHNIVVVKSKTNDKPMVFDEECFPQWMASWDIQDIEWIKPTTINFEAP